MPISDDSLTPAGQNLSQAFEALVDVLNASGVRYAIIGGQAMLYHTRPRMTDDIDALLVVPQLAMPDFFDSLGRRGFQLEPLTTIRQLRDEGLTRINYAGVAVDLMRPIIPAYTHVLDRAMTMAVRGRNVQIGSAEGLIVTKLVAMRLQDQADIYDLLRHYRARLDLEFIRRELATFAAPDDARHALFEKWVRETRESD